MHTTHRNVSRVQSKIQDQTKVVLVGFCFMDGPALASSLGKHLGRPVELNNDMTVFDEEKHSNTLLLVNRDINPDIVDGEIPEMYQDGIKLIKDLEAHHPKALVALVSNRIDAETQATTDGAALGFGKAEILDTATPDFTRFDALIEQAAGSSKKNKTGPKAPAPSSAPAQDKPITELAKDKPVDSEVKAVADEDVKERINELEEEAETKGQEDDEDSDEEV